MYFSTFLIFSNHGACLNGTCACDDMFTGDKCSVHQCPGWTAIAPNDQCSGNGQCDLTTGHCDCGTGWIGESCAVKSCPNECTGHGTCGVEGNCSCHTSWTGDDCSTRYVVHGVLLDDGQDGVKCFPDWGGPDCNTRYVKSVFVIHVGGTRCVTSSTDTIMKIHFRITLNVEFIRRYIFKCLFDV